MQHLRDFFSRSVRGMVNQAPSCIDCFHDNKESLIRGDNCEKYISNFIAGDAESSVRDGE